MSIKTHDYEKYAGAFAELEMQGTQYLAFRDIPMLIREYAGSIASVLIEVSNDGARCLIPGFDGAIFTQAWKEALWARFFAGAPQRLRRSVKGR